MHLQWSAETLVEAAKMKAEEFEAIVRKLEVQAASNPKGYLCSVIGWALLGYAFIYGSILCFIFMFGLLLLLLLVLGSWILFFEVLVFIALLAPPVAQSLWVKFEEPDGVQIEAKDAPELFQMLSEINRTSKSPRIHKVLLNESSNCAVMQVPRLGLFGWYQNFLILGLPLMQSVSLPELKSALAHELGHLSGAHGKIRCWIYHASESWRQLRSNQAYETMAEFALIKGVADWFLPMFDAHSLVLRREHEYAADRIAGEIAGSEIAAQALIQTAIKATFLDEKYWPDYWSQAEHSVEPPWNTFSAMKAALQISVDKDEAFKLLQKNWAKHDPRDTHPALSKRVRALLPQKDWNSLLEISEEAARAFLVERSAADLLFAERLPDFEAKIEKRWHGAIGARWLSQYRTATADQHRLLFLEEAAHHRKLSRDEMHELAQLSYALDDRNLAIEKYRHLLMSLPNDPNLRFGLGLMLLKKGDAAGVVELEEAVRLLPLLGGDAYGAIAGFFRSLEQESEAEQYEKKSQRHGEEIAEAKACLNCITPEDVYDEHELTPTEIDAFCVAVSYVTKITSCYIVAKKVPEIVGGHQHFLVFKLGFGLNNAARARQVIEELATFPLLSGFFLVAWPAASKNLANACTTLPSALVFDRKKWTEPLSEVAMSSRAHNK